VEAEAAAEVGSGVNNDAADHDMVDGDFAGAGLRAKRRRMQSLHRRAVQVRVSIVCAGHTLHGAMLVGWSLKVCVCKEV
jgi:hypothetical protein